MRVRMVCTQKTPYPCGDETHFVISFAPVYGNGEANKEWSTWIPAGSLSLHVTNAEAIKTVELGKEFFMDITEAN